MDPPRSGLLLGLRSPLAREALLVDGSYVERRTALERLRIAGPCGVVPRYPGSDAQALLEACAAHDVEDR